jgi:hypothetical protein
LVYRKFIYILCSYFHETKTGLAKKPEEKVIKAIEVFGLLLIHNLVYLDNIATLKIAVNIIKNRIFLSGFEVQASLRFHFCFTTIFKNILIISATLHPG